MKRVAIILSTALLVVAPLAALGDAPKVPDQPIRSTSPAGNELTAGPVGKPANRVGGATRSARELLDSREKSARPQKGKEDNSKPQPANVVDK